MTDEILRIRDNTIFAEAALCVGNPDRAAEDLAELARAMGLIVARATNGDTKASSDLLDGASQLMFETAADFAPLAALQRLSRKTPRAPR
jgi:hypothetical protein